MLQQRFLITLFFSLAIFLIKFLLFFVQFSVHFLFFTCFFYYKKILHLFHFFIVSHPLSLTHCWFCFVRWKLPALDAGQGAQTSENVAAAAAGVQNWNFTLNTGRWGFVGCVCLCFVYGLWFLFVWVYVVFFTSLYICNIFVIYNIYTWFFVCFAHSFLLFIACLSSLLASPLKVTCFHSLLMLCVCVCLAVTCLLCYNICCCLIK